MPLHHAAPRAQQGHAPQDGGVRPRAQHHRRRQARGHVTGGEEPPVPEPSGDPHHHPGDPAGDVHRQAPAPASEERGMGGCGRDPRAVQHREGRADERRTGEADADRRRISEDRTVGHRRERGQRRPFPRGPEERGHRPQARHPPRLRHRRGVPARMRGRLPARQAAGRPRHHRRDAEG